METNVESTRDEIAVTSSSTVLVRAGLANILLFVVLVATILGAQALSDVGVSLPFRIAAIVMFAIAGLKLYSRTVARIYKTTEGELVIVGPFTSSRIPLSEIRRVRIHTSPLSQTIYLLIYKRKNRLPVLCFFVAVQTNQGSFEATRTKLSSLLGEFITQ